MAGVATSPLVPVQEGSRPQPDAGISRGGAPARRGGRSPPLRSRRRHRRRRSEVAYRAMLSCARRLCLLPCLGLAACGPGASTPPDLRAVGLEVTQTIQTPDNSVLLVAGKRTFARLYVTREKIDHFDPPTVSATLEGFRNGTSLGSLTPLNPGGALAITGEY